jgi:acyl-CoA synthetase (AMP-forming)/AMP-acid ligase II
MKPTFFDFPVEDRLTDRWKRHATARPDDEAIIHWVAGEAPVDWKWGELVCRAEEFAGWLRAMGVRQGQVCALIIRHHPLFYPLYLGVCMSGALPAVLAYPNPRLHPDKFRQGLEGMARTSGLDWVLIERDFESVIRDLVLKVNSTVRGMLFPLEAAAAAESVSELPPALTVTAAEPCLLQHSSGTTGLQKAVVLSHRSVLSHLQSYGEAIELTPVDKVVSWLPLYHDMGLIAAFHLALAFGIPLVQLDPFEWVQAPVILLEAASREGCSLAWLPNFAYHHMAERIHEEELEGLHLDHVRMLVNCSEPVRAEAHDKFLTRFGRYGIRAEVLTACYAMAETTFAVTQTEPGRAARQLWVDRVELGKGRVRLVAAGPEARACVSSGRPLSNTTLRVINERGDDVSKDRVGELVVQSGSMFDGYRNNPSKTAEVLKGDWYFTGDYGFQHDGEYYIIGRKKDIIIVAGKNIYPEDIEDAVSQVPGVIPGRVVAFGVDDILLGTEQVNVLLECEKCDVASAKQLKAAVVQAGMSVGVTIACVHLVPPRWLIKSSSGKPSRKANRDRILNEMTADGSKVNNDFRSTENCASESAAVGRVSDNGANPCQRGSGLGLASPCGDSVGGREGVFHPVQKLGSASPEEYW